MGRVSRSFGILTAADVWTYGVRRMSQTILLSLGAAVNVPTGGAWTQLVAVMGNDAYGILVKMVNAAIAVENAEVDLAIGVGGAEVEIVHGLQVALHRNGVADIFENSREIYLPNVLIPAGARLTARNRTGSANISVEIMGAG